MISKPLRSQFMYFTGSLLQSIDWVFKPGDSKSQPRGWKTKSQGQKLHSEHELRSQRLKNAILRFQFQRSGFWRSGKLTYMNRLLVASLMKETFFTWNQFYINFAQQRWKCFVRKPFYLNVASVWGKISFFFRELN